MLKRKCSTGGKGPKWRREKKRMAFSDLILNSKDWRIKIQSKTDIKLRKQKTRREAEKTFR